MMKQEKITALFHQLNFAQDGSKPELEAFIEAHGLPAPVSVRYNSSKHACSIPLPQVPWCTQACYLPERPSFTLDPYFHTGSYYVQEASSMLTGYIFDQLYEDKSNLTVLDLCAAPGGKSTHIADLLDPETSLLISNEVIQTRAAILAENTAKWGYMNHWVTQSDPHQLGILSGYFDAVIIDAPCTGSGLWRKDEAAMDEWSAANVKLCSERQKRIIADIAPAVRENGYILYSTCSYSKEENEDIVDWICKTLGWESVRVGFPPEWGISVSHTEDGNTGYRCLPWQSKGEGFFISLLKNPHPVPAVKHKGSKGKQSRNGEADQLLQNWLGTDARFIDKREMWCAIPKELYRHYQLLEDQHIRLKKTGTAMGKLIRNELIPHEELALSVHLRCPYPAVDLDKETAIQYLKKEEILTGRELKGWRLVTYRGVGLGWGKWMQQRMNNYYPKQWRIRMQ